MNDLTVTCGCSRKMTLDTMRGRGAYRCGCGASVTISQPKPRPVCVGIEKSDRCVHAGVRESAEYGVPLCGDHLARLKFLLHAAQAGRKAVDEELATGSAFRRTNRQAALDGVEKARKDGTAVVYYMRIGDLIKIGTTTKLRERLGALMPDELLATEPGYRELETVRHQQFADLRVRGERFKPGEELLSHIDMIRRHYGPPKQWGDTRNVSEVS